MNNNTRDMSDKNFINHTDPRPGTSSGRTSSNTSNISNISMNSNRSNSVRRSRKRTRIHDSNLVHSTKESRRVVERRHYITSGMDVLSEDGSDYSTRSEGAIDSRDTTADTDDSNHSECINPVHNRRKKHKQQQESLHKRYLHRQLQLQLQLQKQRKNNLVLNASIGFVRFYYFYLLLIISVTVVIIIIMIAANFKSISKIFYTPTTVTTTTMNTLRCTQTISTNSPATTNTNGPSGHASCSSLKAPANDGSYNELLLRL